MAYPCLSLICKVSVPSGHEFIVRNEEIGLEQMDEDVHRVFFCNTELGELNSSE